MRKQLWYVAALIGTMAVIRFTLAAIARLCDRQAGNLAAAAIWSKLTSTKIWHKSWLILLEIGYCCLTQLTQGNYSVSNVI